MFSLGPAYVASLNVHIQRTDSYRLSVGVNVGVDGSGAENIQEDENTHGSHEQNTCNIRLSSTRPFPSNTRNIRVTLKLMENNPQ